MIDLTTRKPLRVSTDSAARSYIDVPASQLDELCSLLDQHQILYTVQDEVISLNGGPETGIVNLARGSDPAIVQAILDGAR
jgi:hypothetical protein